MKKVFIDTNIILDVILERKSYMLASSNVLAMQIWGQINLYGTALTFLNALYICRKSIGKEQAISKLKELFKHIKISPLGQDEYNKALLLSEKDIEDNFQYISAVSAGCDVLVTRNTKDFPKNGIIPVLEPQDFLDSLA